LVHYPFSCPTFLTNAIWRDKIHLKILFSNYLHTIYNILVGGDVFGKEETVTQYYRLSLFISSKLILQAQNTLHVVTASHFVVNELIWVCVSQTKWLNPINCSVKCRLTLVLKSTETVNKWVVKGGVKSNSCISWKYKKDINLQILDNHTDVTCNIHNINKLIHTNFLP